MEYCAPGPSRGAGQDRPMINKREKLQYAYVFALDLLTLGVSVLLAWLITDGLLGRIVPSLSQSPLRLIISSR